MRRSKARRPSPSTYLALVTALASLLAAATVAGCASESPAALRTRWSATTQYVPASTPSAQPATPSAPDTSTMRPVFCDEFDGPRLDASRWQTELPWGRTNGEELQYYDPAALRVADGMLTMTTQQGPAAKGKRYTSGIIATFDRFEMKYGYVEMRARVPKGQGLWPAFWMLSTKKDDPTEIDIAEFIGGKPYQVQTTLHWGMGSAKKHTGIHVGTDYSAEFHTYAVDWQRDKIVWYVDGIERLRVTDHIPAVPMYLITNVAVGGRYPGPPDGTTPSRAEYAIDYIRVYDRD